MPENVLLSKLRQETRPQHQALDALVGPELTQSFDRYARFLRGSLSAVEAIEPSVKERLGHEFFSDRAPRLRDDVRALAARVGDTGDLQRPSLVSSVAASSAIHSEAAAWGAAYVLEGSALGGKVLAARVRDDLGAAAPTAYLSLHGTGTADHWRAFLARLDAFSLRSSPVEHDEAVSAAASTFDLFASAYAAAFVVTEA